MRLNIVQVPKKAFFSYRGRRRRLSANILASFNDYCLSGFPSRTTRNQGLHKLCYSPFLSTKNVTKPIL